MADGGADNVKPESDPWSRVPGRANLPDLPDPLLKYELNSFSKGEALDANRLVELTQPLPDGTHAQLLRDTGNTRSDAAAAAKTVPGHAESPVRETGSIRQIVDHLTNAHALNRMLTKEDYAHLNRTIVQARADFKAAGSNKSSGNADFCHQALNITGDIAITAAAIALAPETGGLSLGAEALIMAGTRLAVSGAVYSIGEGLKGQTLDGKYDWSFGNLIKQAAIGSTIGLTGHLGPELLFGRIGAGAAGETVAKLVSSAGAQAIDQAAVKSLTKQLATVFGQSAISGRAPAASALQSIIGKTLSHLPLPQQAEIVETIAGQAAKRIPQAVGKELDRQVAESALKLGMSAARLKAVEASAIGGANVVTTIAASPFTGHLTWEDLGTAFATGTAAGLALPAAGKLLKAIDQSAGGAISRGAKDLAGHFQEKFLSVGKPAGAAHDAKFPAPAQEAPASVLAELKAMSNLSRGQAGSSADTHADIQTGTQAGIQAGTQADIHSDTYTAGSLADTYLQNGTQADTHADIHTSAQAETPAVTHVFPAGPKHVLHVEYVLDQTGTTAVPNKITLREYPDGNRLPLLTDKGTYTKGKDGWYSCGSDSSDRTLVGTEARVNADGSVTFTGEGEYTELGSWRSLNGAEIKIDSITHKPDGSLVEHYVDGASTTIDAGGRLQEMVALNGTRFELQYDGSQLNKLVAGQNTYSRSADGTWVDQKSKLFAQDITAEADGEITIKPPETFRVEGREGRQVESLVATIDGRTEVIFKNKVPFAVEREPGLKPPAHDQVLASRVARGDLVRQPDGTFVHTGITGEKVHYDAQGLPVSVITAENLERRISYKDGQLNEVETTENGKPYLMLSRQEDGQWLECDRYGKDATHYAQVSVSDDGTVSKIKANWWGSRDRPDGLHVLVRPDGTEKVYKDALKPERTRIEKSATSLIGDTEHSQRFLTHMQEFQERALKRVPPLSDEEITNTYYQIDKLLSTDSAILPLRERVHLAEQFMLEAAHPEMIDQGSFKTCNVTAEFQNRMFTRHPADAARLIAEVATTGRYTTYGDGSVIDMSQMNNMLRPFKEAKNPLGNQFKPGSIADLKIDGERNFLDQIFQSTAVETYWQRLDVDPYTSMPVRSASTIHDLRAGAAHQPGDLRYELSDKLAGGGAGEYIANYANGKAAYMDSWEHRTAKDPVTGAEVRMLELLPSNGPSLTSTKILSLQDALYQTKSVERAHYLERDVASDARVIGVKTVAGLTDDLKRMKAEGILPATVAVDTHDSLFKSIAERIFDRTGGGHVMNIQNIYEKDGKWMVELTNQWGSKHNHLGPRAVPVEDLFRAMKDRPADDAGLPVKEILIGGAVVGAVWATSNAALSQVLPPWLSQKQTDRQESPDQRENADPQNKPERDTLDVPPLRDYYGNSDNQKSGR